MANGHPDKDARLWAMLCHLSTFAVWVGIPFGNILGPLIIWLIKKDEYPLVNDQGKEALNFQISMTIYSIVSVLLCFVLVGFVLIPIIVIADVVLTIIAAIKANDGIPYRYPMTIRLVS